MEFALTRADGGLEPEDVYRYYSYKRRHVPWYDSESFNQYMHEKLGSDSRSLIVLEQVPRGAVKYMNVSRFYELIDTDNEYVTDDYQIRSYTVTQELSNIVEYGGRTARLADEEFFEDPLESVHNGPVLLCKFALSKRYVVEIIE